MSHSGPHRSWRTWLAGICLLCAAASGAWSQDRPSVDPVEDLRLALQREDVLSRPDWPKVPIELVADFRSKNLSKKIDALRTIGELRRALALEEWREDLGGREAALRQIDQDKRREVGTRLLDAIRREVFGGDANTKLAVANMICEMGPTVRALELKDRSGFARSLTPEVLKLCVNSDIGVRQEALRALGNINAEPDKAAKRFEFILKNDRPEIRLLAALGLGQMTRVVHELRVNGLVNKTGSRVDATNADVTRTAHEVVPASRAGLKDAEPLVRAACLDAIRISADNLANQYMIKEPFERKEFPPEGRKLAPAEVQKILDIYESVRQEINEVRPYFQLLRDTAPDLIDPLTDPEAGVRLAAVTALESIAQARLMQRKRLESVSLDSDAAAKADLIVLDDPLAKFMPRGLPALARLLKDPDVRIRRTALDFLQNIDRDARGAIREMIAALGDPDRYVRWAATTVFGKMSVKETEGAVPGLGKLLSDDDLKIRQIAAGALQRMGPLAHGALSAINQAIVHGDVEARLAVFKVVTGLAREDSQTCVPNLIAVLSHEDARVRKADCETLGKLGSVARDAIPALRRLIGDYDPEVRRAASDAILSITARPER